MTTAALSLNETDQRRINHAIQQLQQGRNNAHGSFTLSVSPATSVSVSAPNCAAGCHVSVTPTSANAADVTGLYVTATNGSFTVTHDATVNADCTFTFGIVG